VFARKHLADNPRIPRVARDFGGRIDGTRSPAEIAPGRLSAFILGLTGSTTSGFMWPISWRDGNPPGSPRWASPRLRLPSAPI
jgi:hypothetical protein